MRLTRQLVRVTGLLWLGALAEQSLRIAAQLAAGDEQAQQRVREASSLGQELSPANP